MVNNQVAIPVSDLRYVFSRSSGPGGQNVNKVNTRVTLLFDLSACDAMTAPQRARVARRLAGWMGRDGTLRVVSSRHRTQVANRRAATERFVALLAEALAKPKPRIKTRVTRAAVERRRRQKAQRSQLKRQRRSRPGNDD
ncbi:MAG: aminoacyl-tRNA hydrolase [bacterium]|nr:aminoacyl-tRNA hydrolase [bacterium]